MKRRLPFSFLMFFMLPLGIILFVTWRGYSSELHRNGKPDSSYLKGLYFIEDGSRLVAATEGESFRNLVVRVLEPASGERLMEGTVKSQVHGILPHVSYHNGAVLLPTYDGDSGLQLNLISGERQPEELTEGSLSVPGYLTGGVRVWRGHLVIHGNQGDAGFYMAEVSGGELRRVDLEEPGLFPTRPERLSSVSGTAAQELPLPVLEVQLKDGQRAHIAGLIEPGQPLPVRLVGSSEGIFAARETAGQIFAEQMGINSTRLIREQSEYPGEAVFYNAVTKKTVGTLPTPKPVYQAKVFPLNDRETLVAGSTAKDEREGQMIGYLYEEQSGLFRDAMPLLASLSYKALTDTKLSFSKEAGSPTLYYSQGALSAGWMDVENGQMGIATAEQVKAWLLKPSLSGIWHYLLENTALLINLLVWGGLWLVFIGAMAVVAWKSRKRALHIQEGLCLPAEILKIQETGTLINDQPLVLLTVRFEAEGRMIEHKQRALFSVVAPYRVGDPIMVSYNPHTGKTLLLTEESAEELAKARSTNRYDWHS